jgi:hypothetical protein
VEFKNNLSFSSPDMVLKSVNMVPYDLYNCSHYPFTAPNTVKHIELKSPFLTVTD